MSNSSWRIMRLAGEEARDGNAEEIGLSPIDGKETGGTLIFYGQSSWIGPL